MRHALFAFGFLITVGMAGCGPMQRAQMQDRRAAVDAEAAACEQQFKSGAFKTHVEVATCANDAYGRGISAGLYPYPDIRLAWGAARLRISEQLDRHEISATEATARWMEARAAASAEAQRRNAEGAQRNAEIDTMNAVSTGVYMNMIGTGVGMMQGR